MGRWMSGWVDEWVSKWMDGLSIPFIKKKKSIKTPMQSQHYGSIFTKDRLDLILRIILTIYFLLSENPIKKPGN